MNKFALLFGFLLFVSFQSYGQSDEVEEITKCLNYYLDGGTNNDFEMLQKAFHPDARMKYLRNGEFHDVNAVEFFQGVMKPGGAKQERESKILHIDYSGHVGHAKLRIDYPKFSFIDYMNLVKIEDEWKIVNKIFHRENKM